MSCTVDARDRARAAARQLEADPRVLAVDVLDPSTDPTNQWTVDVFLVDACDGIPAPVVATIGQHQLSIRDVSPQNDHWQALATA